MTTYKSIRNLSACVEKRGELGWVVGCSLGGERWDEEEEGEEEGEIEEESVGRVCIYGLLPMESPTNMFCWYTHQWFRRWKCHVTIRRSRFESLDHSIGNIVWNKSTSSHHCNSSKKLYSPLTCMFVVLNIII